MTAGQCKGCTLCSSVSDSWWVSDPPSVGGLPFPASTLEEPFSSTREHHVASTKDDYIPTDGLLTCVCVHVHFNSKIYLPFSFPLPLTALHFAIVFIDRLWQFLAPYSFPQIDTLHVSRHLFSMSLRSMSESCTQRTPCITTDLGPCAEAFGLYLETEIDGL